MSSSRSTAASTRGFLALISRRLDAARIELRVRLAATAAALPDALRFDIAHIEAALFDPLPDRIERMLTRTLVLELHVADLSGRLAARSPAQRFEQFIDQLASPQVEQALLSEYPVLDELVDTALRQWVDASAQLVDHFATDWSEIETRFAPQGLAVPIHIAAGAGDLHRGGRTVAVVTFEGGQKLVYKPRSLAADLHVQELLDWCNARLAGRPFRTMTVLDCGDHGWVEFVETGSIDRSDDARAYYHRFGALLAIGYVLGAIDMHFENVIASGDDPVIVDLETLFHPTLVALDERDAVHRALAAMNESVMASGLLPQRLYGGGTDVGMDVSGIGVEGRQRTPFPVVTWADAGSTSMRMVRAHRDFEISNNRARVGGEATDPVVHAGDIVGGFDAIHRLVVQHRDALLAPGGPIARFADDEVRVLLRPTRSYFRLLDESYHPDVLRDRRDRDELFDRLANAAPTSPILTRAMVAERADLWRGDIPVFTTTPSSRDLFTSTHERIASALAEPGLDACRRRIMAMDDVDLDRQRWFIRASLSTLESSHRLAPVAPHAAPPPRISRDRLVAAAEKLADRLVATAIHGASDVAWVGLTAIGDSARLGPLGIDLYDGVPGVALFLGHAGAATGRRDLTELARAATRATLARQERDDPADALTNPGGFVGAGGLVYAFAQLAALWGDPSLLDAARDTCRSVLDSLAADTAHDVVSGAAGGLLGIASLWHLCPEPATRAAVSRCADALLEASLAADGVRWWPSPIGGHPLTGMSHGVAGITAALAEAAAITGDARYAHAARESLEWERGTFDEVTGNWPDFRRGAEAPVFQTAWCHGAPGIGLARLRAPGAAFDERAAREVGDVVATTLAQGVPGSHCLCHGGFGNLELLSQAARRLDGSAAGARAAAGVAEWSATLLADLERHGPRCATKLGVETPGMMTGLAGIGLALLRLAAPDEVPSVLTLEPPAPVHAGQLG